MRFLTINPFYRFLKTLMVVQIFAQWRTTNCGACRLSNLVPTVILVNARRKWDDHIDINTSGVLARLQRALSKMAEVWECLLMKLTANKYYVVFFCMFEEPAMFKPLSYSSKFVSIRQPLVLSTDNASFNAKNIRASSPDLFMSTDDPGKDWENLPKYGYFSICTLVNFSWRAKFSISCHCR